MKINLLVLAQPDCTKCNRSQDCNMGDYCGVPSRLGDVSGTLQGGPALLVVGEQPGYQETRAGRCFVGVSGAFLQDIYLQSALTRHFSAVYYGNAIRCQHRRNIAVTHLAACRPYLMADIRNILALHGSLVILALGRHAARCLLNRGVRDAFKVQGKPLPDAFWLNYPRLKKGAPPLDVAPELLPVQPIPIFSTYHPAALMSGRNPSYRRAVFDHLSLLSRAMESPLVNVVSTSGDTPQDLEILRGVQWTSPGEAHHVPEPTS